LTQRVRRSGDLRGRLLADTAIGRLRQQAMKRRGLLEQGMGGCPNKPRRSRPIHSSLSELSGLSTAILENDAPWLIRGTPQPRTNVFGEVHDTKEAASVVREQTKTVITNIDGDTAVLSTNAFANNGRQLLLAPSRCKARRNCRRSRARLAHNSVGSAPSSPMCRPTLAPTLPSVCSRSSSVSIRCPQRQRMRGRFVAAARRGCAMGAWRPPEDLNL
jgi:hypothetical protein